MAELRAIYLNDPRAVYRFSQTTVLQENPLGLNCRRLVTTIEFNGERWTQTEGNIFIESNTGEVARLIYG